MAAEVLTGTQLTVAGTDISSWVTDVTLENSADALEDTAFGDAARTRIPGLTDGNLSFTFHMDYASSATYATISAIFGTVATTVLKKDSGAVATTNPSFTQSVMVTGWNLVGASLGTLHEQSVTWPLASAITVATA